MHVSFDFDYTLADSTRGIVACINHAMRRLGLAARDPSMITPTIGLPLEKTLVQLTGRSNPGEAALFKQYFLEHAERVMLDNIHFFTVTRPVLAALRQAGHYISIVSTKERERIEAALVRDGLDGFVDQVIGGNCVKHNKPHPEGLLRAMRESGIPKADTIYVGDSVSDGECAMQAGVRFVAVLSGRTSAEVLSEWRPWKLLSHVGELTA